MFADTFAQRFMRYFLGEHRPLGEALTQTSQDAFEVGNPFPLIYALYAPPELTTV